MMKKLFLSCMSAMAFTLAVHAAQPGENPTAKKIVDLNEYKGVLMYGATMLDASGPTHYVKFYSKKGYELTNVAPIDPADDGLHLIKLRCGTLCGDTYYGYICRVFTFVDQPNQFVSIDFNTGKVNVIHQFEFTDEWPTIYEMAYDRERKTCWALARGTRDYATSDVYEINTTDGSFSRVAELDYYAWAMAVDYDGNAYVIKGKPDSKNEYYEGSYLVKLDVDEDFASVDSTELKVDGQSVIPNFDHSMDFDNNSNLLYWLSTSNDGYQRLYKIDPKKKTMVKESDMVYNEVVGLAIPFEGADSREAAGKVTNLTASSPDDGTMKASLSWTNPSVNWRGDNLTEFKEVTVSRGTRDNVVATLPGTAGQECTWDDTNPTQGVVTYYLTPYRISGEKGLVDSVKVFVGQDAPGNVQNLTASAEGNNVSLKWEAPAVSHTGKGYDKNSLRYEITRTPGNKVVASDVTGTTYTDTDPDFFNYYTYTVTSKNDYGTGDSESVKLYAGKAYEPTFFEDFENAVQAARWQAVDNDNTGKTFTYAGGNFEEFKCFIDYMDAYKATDDYIFSPLVHLKGGQTYRVSMRALLRDVEQTHAFNFTYGSKPTAESQQTIAKHENLTARQDLDARDFADLFTPSTDGDYYLGVRCLSAAKVAGDRNIYFGVRNFKVEEVKNNDMAAVALTIPYEVSMGNKASATVKVMNAGKNEQSKYTVQVVDDKGGIWGTKTIDESLASQATKDVEIEITPAGMGKNNVYGKVVLDGDERAENDTTSATQVEVRLKGLDWNIECNGDGASQSTTEPISFLNPYSTMQTTYLNTELGDKDGSVKGIAFEYTPNDISADTEDFNVKVYMGQTTNDDSYSDASQWVNNSELTLVYDGNQHISSGTDSKMLKLELDQPFDYDHTKNLIVQVWKDGTTSEMFPALFNIYKTANWETHMLRYSGKYVFDFSATSFAMAGKPVAFFAIDFATGLKTVIAGDGFFVDSANGFISLNGTARSIEVFDMQGRLVSHSVNTARVEINGISRGMYIVRVTDMNGNVISKKILLGK